MHAAEASDLFHSGLLLASYRSFSHNKYAHV